MVVLVASASVGHMLVLLGGHWRRFQHTVVPLFALAILLRLRLPSNGLWRMKREGKNEGMKTDTNCSSSVSDRGIEGSKGQQVYP
jgi:hypothetical protein